MTIRKKIYRIFTVFSIILIASLFYYTYFIIIKGYEKAEALEIRKNMIRAEESIEVQLGMLEKITLDWAIWDDMYQFAEDKNKEFENVNLIPTTYELLKIDFMYVLNNSGEIVYAKQFNSKTDKFEPIPKGLIINSVEKGFIANSDGKIALLVSHDIFKSDKTGVKKGIVGIGYYVEGERVNDIRDYMKEDISLKLSSIKNERKFLVEKINSNTIVNTVFYETINNKGIVEYSFQINRDINILGRKSSKEFILYFIITFCIFMLIMFIFLKKTVYERVEILTKKVKEIRDKYGENIQIEFSGNDELSELKNEINSFIKELAFVNTKLKAREEKYRALYNESAALHIIVNEKYEIVDMNNAVLKLLEKNRDDIIGKKISEIVHKDDLENILRFIDEIFIGIGDENIEIKLKTENGKIFYIQLYPTNLFISEENNNYTALITGSDITQRKLIEQKLKELAIFDEMTQVLNRRAGLEILEQQINSCRATGKNLSICYIDVNDLKKVNDKFGHFLGDMLINDAVKILKECIRESDYIVRLGGDEFLLILPECDNNSLNMITNRIDTKCFEFNEKKLREYKLTVSYGSATYKENFNMKINEFIEVADSRMYEYKKNMKAKKR